MLLLACVTPPDPVVESGGIDTGPVVVEDYVPDVLCSPEERAGLIGLSRTGDDRVILGARIFDGPTPAMGLPAIEGPDCVFHLYEPGACDCDDDRVCAGDGSCRAEPRARFDLLVEVEGYGAFAADETTGLAYGDLGSAEELYTLTVEVAGQRVELPPLQVGPRVEVEIEIDDNEMAPGELIASWTPPETEGRMRTVIPINHHAAPGTFTVCDVASSAGGFTASAEQIDPLAVVTGLEFQGMASLQGGHIPSSDGCIEVAASTGLRNEVTFVTR